MTRLELSTRLVAVRADDRHVPLAPRDAALLAWLAIEGPTTRARLAQLLWPASGAVSARNTLRQRLFRLRRQCGELVCGQATIELAAGVTVDAGDAGTLLGDLQFADAPEFDAWLARQRQRRRAAWRARLERQAQELEDSGELDAALRVVDTLLAHDSLDETAHRRAMHLHYLRGDRAAALLAFDRCERVLKDEVGARPSPETLALLATVERAAVAAPAPVPPLPVSVLRPPRLVGRETELAALHQTWDAGGAALVIGEAGVGKTRLLSEFLEARRDVVIAAARPGDAGVPFATLARLLRAIAARNEASADSPSVLAHQSVLRLVPELDSASLRLGGEGQRLRLHDALRGWLDANVAQAGFVVDDLHFADEASVEILAALVADPSKQRWALASRPAEAGSQLKALVDGLAEQAKLEIIELRALDQAALEALLDSLAIDGVDARAVAGPLWRRTGGNPLFALETIKQAWTERRLHELAHTPPQPPSVRRLIARRLSQLSPGAVALARVAAIAGPDFDIALAEHVLGTTALRFADELAELEAAHVLRGTQFAHDLVFDAVRDGVPAAIARHTHAAIAGWLEQRGGEPARIARHWTAASRPRNALPWLDRAAQAAAAALRLKEQAAFLEERARLQADLGERSDAFATLLALADLLTTVDDTGTRSLALCDQLDALADDDAARVRAALQRAHILYMRGELAPSQRVAERALATARRVRGEPALVAEARVQLASALLLQDRAAEALPHFDAAHDWVDARGDDDRRCEFHANYALALDKLGRVADSVAHHEAAISLAQRTGHHGNITMCQSNFAANRMLCGRLADAERLLARVRLERAQSADTSSVDGMAAMLQAICDLQGGRYRSALQALAHSEQRLAEHAPGFGSAVLLHLGVCWAHLGQWARLQRLLSGLGDVQRLTSATRLRALWLVVQLDTAQGRRSDVDALRAALAAAQSAPPDMQHALRLEIAARLAPADALAEAEAVARDADALGHAGTVIAARARAAWLAATLGDARGAARHVDAAAELSRDHAPLRQYPAEGWLHMALALGAMGRDADADARVQAAAAWVRRAARDEVPPEYRDGFLWRNAVNRRLLALTSRERRGT